MSTNKARFMILLAGLRAIVNDTTAGWELKRDYLFKLAKENGYETELMEFLSWFDERNEE